eukprot:CAMPEP_0119309956 /NCGR_PEP_ID=MMETSP1333-20130426/17616_1 /TAXON_ID=418940 /ORGANISM="Scyphosphaera apsteinii, Strain RCC1455" /LENGTH=85 /DNA_ID=CAMNT_0007314051 /DNA_START=21 /DNA_END=278 /DNA_ORIENTATION=-
MAYVGNYPEPVSLEEYVKVKLANVEPLRKDTSENKMPYPDITEDFCFDARGPCVPHDAAVAQLAMQWANPDPNNPPRYILENKKK